MKLTWMMWVYVVGGLVLGTLLGSWLGAPFLVGFFGTLVGAALGVAFRP
jgi:hypothetical protein